MTSTQARIREAVRAGSVRDYARAIRILEELAASGKAEGCHHPDGGAVYERVHRKSGMRGRLSRTRTVGMVRRTRILRFICILRVHTTHKGSMRAR